MFGHRSASLLFEVMQHATESLPQFHSKPQWQPLQRFLIEELPVLQICNQSYSALPAEVAIWKITPSTGNRKCQCQGICTVLFEFVECPHIRSVTVGVHSPAKKTEVVDNYPEGLLLDGECFHARDGTEPLRTAALREHIALGGEDSYTCDCVRSHD